MTPLVAPAFHNHMSSLGSRSRSLRGSASEGASASRCAHSKCCRARAPNAAEGPEGPSIPKVLRTSAYGINWRSPALPKRYGRPIRTSAWLSIPYKSSITSTSLAPDTCFPASEASFLCVCMSSISRDPVCAAPRREDRNREPAYIRVEIGPPSTTPKTSMKLSGPPSSRHN